MNCSETEWSVDYYLKTIFSDVSSISFIESNCVNLDVKEVFIDILQDERFSLTLSYRYLSNISSENLRIYLKTFWETKWCFCFRYAFSHVYRNSFSSDSDATGILVLPFRSTITFAGQSHVNLHFQIIKDLFLADFRSKYHFFFSHFEHIIQFFTIRFFLSYSPVSIKSVATLNLILSIQFFFIFQIVFSI